MCACVRACVRARACVSVRVRVCVRMCVLLVLYIWCALIADAGTLQPGVERARQKLKVQ